MTGKYPDFEFMSYTEDAHIVKPDLNLSWLEQLWLAQYSFWKNDLLATGKGFLRKKALADRDRLNGLFCSRAHLLWPMPSLGCRRCFPQYVPPVQDPETDLGVSSRPMELRQVYPRNPFYH